MSNFIVCFNREHDIHTIKTLLGHYGYRVAYSCMSGAKALEGCDKLGSGIILSGYRLNDMVCRDLYESKPDPFAMIAIASPKNWVQEIPPEGLAVLDMPFRAGDLIAKVEAAEEMLERRRAAQRKKGRGGEMMRSPEERALIGEAKRLLMRKRGYDEPRAHRFLQELAMTSGASLLDTAQKVLVSI